MSQIPSDPEETMWERVKTQGFELGFDPPRDGTKCFYAATGHQLGMNAADVQKKIFEYLRQHRYQVYLWFRLLFTHNMNSNCGFFFLDGGRNYARVLPRETFKHILRNNTCWILHQVPEKFLWLVMEKSKFDTSFCFVYFGLKGFVCFH